MADTLSTLVRQGTQLSSSASQPSSAPSPLESAVSSGSSASPDKAKMAGTPAATRASALQALRAPTDRTKDLATTQRQDTGALKDVQQRYAEDIQQLQQTGNHLAAVSKAAALRDIEEQGLGGSATPELANSSYSPERGALLTKALGGDKAALASLLTDLDPGKNGWTPEEVASMSMEGDAGKQAIKTLLNNYLQTADERLSNYAEGKLTVGEFSKDELTQLGFESTTEMAELFGLPDAAALEAMTVGQLENLVAKVKSDKFNTAEDWQSLAADPSAPKADREMAQMMLKGMGVSGVLADEAEVTRIQQQVDASDQIQWPGVGSVAIGDLLANKDGLMTRQIKAYLGGATTALPSEVAAMVDKNRKTFEAALSKVQGLTGEVVATVKANQELVGSHADLASKIGLNPNSITTKPLTVSNTVFEDYKNLDDNSKKAMDDIISQIQGGDAIDILKQNNSATLLNATGGGSDPVLMTNVIQNSKPVTAQGFDRGGYKDFMPPTNFPVSFDATNPTGSMNNILANLDTWAKNLGLPPFGLPTSVDGIAEATKGNSPANVNNQASIQARVKSAMGFIAEYASGQSLAAQATKANMTGGNLDYNTAFAGKSASDIANEVRDLKSRGLNSQVREKDIEGLQNQRATEALSSTVAKLGQGLSLDNSIDQFKGKDSATLTSMWNSLNVNDPNFAYSEKGRRFKDNLSKALSTQQATEQKAVDDAEKRRLQIQKATEKQLEDFQSGGKSRGRGIR